MKIGTKIPQLSLPATKDQVIDLSQIKSQKLVVYFYPKDNTPGCTNEGIDFKDNMKAFQAAQTVVFGVSRDSIKTHQRFKQKHQFPFDLISDSEELLCKAFDVIKLKKLYGKEYLGIERSTFLFDQQGQLVKQWRKVRVKGHVAEVLQAAEQI